MKKLSETPLSILDLAKYSPGKTVADAYRATKELAQSAEKWGYHRYWLAEHHNLEGVASAATSLLIGYVAENTKTIRVGSGGIMLPNHAPLIVAEQFGTLATLYPGRIDLGLGRAPGADRLTMHALRRDTGLRGGDFAELLEELLYFFAPAQPGQKLKAIPGAGIDVPIWILGSSLYSAQLAARLGLPYAFAGHFAPALLQEAFALYRAEFKSSRFLGRPYTMAGVPVVAAETDERAKYLATSIYQVFLSLVRGNLQPTPPPVESMDGLWNLDRRAEEEAAVNSMVKLLIVGGPEKVRQGLQDLIDFTQADELIITSDQFDSNDRLRSYEIIARVSR
jgi:luciferase family oxidoreductase group 1